MQTVMKAPVAIESSHDLILNDVTVTYPVFLRALAEGNTTFAFTTDFFSDPLSVTQLAIIATRLEAAGSGDEIWIIASRGEDVSEGLLEIAGQFDAVQILDEDRGEYTIERLDVDISGGRLVRSGFETDRGVLEGLEVVVPEVSDGMMVYLFNVFLAASRKDPAFVDTVKDSASVWNLVLEAGQNLVGPANELLRKRIEMQADLLQAGQA